MATEVVCVEDRSDVAAELKRAGEILRRGGLVAFPTETVYGIAVAATIPAAVERLYEIKGRPRDKPMTIMVADVAEVRRRCPSIPAAAERLMERFWPGPLTLVLRDSTDHMTGFRLPNHPLAQGLVREAGVPLLVPSANRAGNPPPTTAEGVLREFPKELDLVIDGGSAEGGVPSSVVQVTEVGIDVLRAGAIPESRLLDSSRTEVLFVCAGNTDRSPLAAAFLRRRLSDRLQCPEGVLEAHGFVVRSAGLEAVDSNRLIVQVRRLIFPFLQGFERGLLEQRRSGHNLHLDHVALLVQDCLNLHRPLNVSPLCKRRVFGMHLDDGLWRFHASTHADGRGLSGRWW